MEKPEPTREELHERIRSLEERLWEAEQTLQAIRSGEVDALVTDGPEGVQLYTLTGADQGYRILVESISEGALILSSDDSIYYCNSTLREMLGAQAGAIVGRRLDSLCPPSFRTQLAELIGKSRSSGAARGECTMNRGDGALLPVNISLNHLKTADFEGVCGVVTDLSQQKRTEEELRRHRTELQSLVNERTAELQREVAERKQSEIELGKSLRENVALIKEIHHRVKNNLQVVVSLLGLQAGRIKDKELHAILEDTRNRVRSMALLHEALYRSGDFANISFGTYISDLCRQIVASHGQLARLVKVERRLGDIELSMDQAVPCALIVNELVSNALKHAFPNNRPGSVVVTFERSDEQSLLLCVQDDGVGMPAGIDPSNSPTLGLLLVSELTGQLLGHLTVERPSEGGTDFRVSFPVFANMNQKGAR